MFQKIIINNIVSMKKLKNALASKGSYHCFGCSPENPRGLKMEFWLDGGDVVSFFEPEWFYDGWKGIMHGGIIATMMDELGEWIIFSQLGTTGVTTDLNVRYKRPVRTDEGKIEIRGTLREIKRNIVFIDVNIRNESGKICAQAEIAYYTFSREQAKEKFDFPDKESFLD